MHKKVLLILFVLVATLTPFQPTVGQGTNSFELTIMHTSDVEGKYLPLDATGLGGAARAATVINTVRHENPNTLLLDVGGRMFDLYNRIWQGEEAARVMNLLRYDAMTLGNQEFNLEQSALANFIRSVEFPVVSSNVNANASTDLNGLIQPYTIIESGSEKIGIIGLTTADTVSTAANAQNVTFIEGYQSVVLRTVAQLTAEDVNIVILLSYLDFADNLTLASTLTGVDVIIGGRGSDLIGNIRFNSDQRLTQYPILIEDSNTGEKRLFVQSGDQGQYMGVLDTTFDAEGNLVEWAGDSVPLFKYIPAQQDVEVLVAELTAVVSDFQSQPVLKPDGDQVQLDAPLTLDGCREQECTLGNLVTDALLFETAADVAIMNGGSLRAALPAGALKWGDIFQVLPFSNVVTIFDISGADLLAALENGVSRVGADSGTGRFPQVAGMAYSYDPSQPEGSRIVEVTVQGSPLDPNTTYRVASNDFLRQGGDGYQVFNDNASNVNDFGRPVDQVVVDYLSLMALGDSLNQGERISIFVRVDTPTPTATATFTPTATFTDTPTPTTTPTNTSTPTMTATATPTNTPTFTATPTPTYTSTPVTCEITVQVNSANLRPSPGPDSPREATLNFGDVRLVIAQANGSDGFIWFQLENRLWVRSDLVSADENCVNLPSDSSSLPTESTGDAGNPTVTEIPPTTNNASTPWLVDLSQICNGSEPSPRLILGQRGWVLPQPPIPNNLRREANANSRDMGDIQPGEYFDVIGGPICSRNLNRWQVMLDDGRVGWTGEGDRSGYWVGPIQEANRSTVRVYEGSCRGVSIVPRLRIGETAAVLAAQSNILYSNPSRPTQDANSSQLRSVPAGEPFAVIGGPICNNGESILWWRVEYNGITGWIGEGEGSDYWVEPLN